MEIIIFFDDFIKLKYHNSPVSNFELKIGQGITKCNTFKKKKKKSNISNRNSKSNPTLDRIPYLFPNVIEPQLFYSRSKDADTTSPLLF